MAERLLSRLLLVEDEKNLGSTLKERLELESFEVVWATSVEDARLELASGHFDLALIDVGLPDGSGFEVASHLKKIRPSTALIFLTAFGTAADRIRGLELGAEDYIVKPFHLKELILRIRNGLRRAVYLSGGLSEAESVVQVGQAHIHLLKFEASVGGKTYPLTHKETALLKLLIERRSCVVSRDEILNHAWSADEYPTPRTVDNFIMRLRRLVEVDPENPRVIKSIRKIGYQLL